MTLAPGAHLGPYEVLSPVGAGGMGEVWRARDPRLEREVAVKILPDRVAADPDALARFEREARAVAALSHPNILAIHDVGESGGVRYAVMELLQGETLRDRLKAGPLPVREAVALARQVARGLSAAHDKGIVHRDLKPENLFVSRNGALKVLDFGLARWTRPLSGSDTGLPTQQVLTAAGAVMGTIGYLSPEQVRGLPIDHRSDLFSFGAVLFEMLSGRRAFQRGSAADTVSAILHEEPRALGGVRLPGRLKETVRRLLEKEAGKRYGSAEEVGRELEAVEQALASAGARRRSVLVRVVAGTVLVAVAAVAGWLLDRERKVRRAREELIPRAEQLLSEGGQMGFQADGRPAYALAVEAEKVVPGDPRLAVVLAQASARTTFRSEPPGAVVSIRPYGEPGAAWTRLGTTPIEGLRLPSSTYVVRFEKEGFTPVVAAGRSYRADLSARTLQPATVQRLLDRSGTLPPGMVRVGGLKELPDFFIDATEVTNQAYKAFVDAGGYRSKELWKDLLASPDGARGWPGAVAGFVDETGRPGPATWQAGDFPSGKALFPVSGVSWYEAAAFAAWAGKELPTSGHWNAARGGSGISPAETARSSNFGGEGPAQVATYPSLSVFGAYDMAGNVREWCSSVAPGGRVVRGGAWNDVGYLAQDVSQASPLDRSPKNGFRCARYVDRQAVPASAFAPVRGLSRPDFYRLRPVPDEVFRAYRDQFSYDRSDLGATVEWRKASPDWVQERVVFNAAYDRERMAAYLFLPARGTPPYQTVVFFPGAGSAHQRSSQDLEHYREFVRFLSHFLKSGRAVVYPVYHATFERGSDAMIPGLFGADTHEYSARLVKVVKDLRRTLDYLETRPELDRGKVAYLGCSWGGMYGAIIPAVEERLQASMLVVAGLDGGVRPEADQLNYVGRVRVPTLMLVGRYDFRFPLDSSARPMFDLLGTPPDRKLLKVYDADHFVPYNEMVKETLAWADRWLGPVK